MSRPNGVRVGLSFVSEHGVSRVSAGRAACVEHENGSVDWRLPFECEIDGEPNRIGFQITARSPSVMMSVADSGEIICCGEHSVQSDFLWLFDRSGGRVMFKKLNRTKLCSVCMAADGSFCCYETEISDFFEDDQKAFVLCARTGETVGVLDCASLFGHGVMPDIMRVERGKVTFDLGGFPVEVSYCGEIINRREWLLHRCEVAAGSDYGYSLFYISSELEPAEALIALKSAANKRFTGLDKAKVYRRIGELLEQSFGDYDGALAAYRAALSIDGNVGIKKHVAALKKNLNGGVGCA